MLRHFSQLLKMAVRHCQSKRASSCNLRRAGSPRCGCTLGLWLSCGTLGCPCAWNQWQLLGEEWLSPSTTISNPAPSLSWEETQSLQTCTGTAGSTEKHPRLIAKQRLCLGFFPLGPNPWLYLKEYQILRIQKQGNVDLKQSSISM